MPVLVAVRILPVVGRLLIAQTAIKIPQTAIKIPEPSVFTALLQRHRYPQKRSDRTLAGLQKSVGW